MSTNKEFFVVCDNIRSLENIGSIFRTADAVGIDKVFLCGVSAKASGLQFRLHPKIAKTALGAQKHIPYEYHRHLGNLIKKLKRENIQIIALENNIKNKKTISLHQFEPRFPLALIVGNEVKGISRANLQVADQVVFIPMKGKKESLNVAVAFGVAAYEINKYR